MAGLARGPGGKNELGARIELLYMVNVHRFTDKLLLNCDEFHDISS